MSARHTASQDQDHRRLAELRFMLGTGAGIQRQPSKLKNVVAALARHTGSLAPNVTGGSGPTILRPLWAAAPMRGYGWKTIEYSDAFDGLPMETDMGHYWALVKEARAIEARLHPARFISGWRPGPQWHASPFGPDRFRHFDPTPAFEVTIGPLHFIGR